MSGLSSSAARGAAVTMVGQVGRIGIQLVSLVILSRLLAPADFGLLAMVVAVIGVGEVLRDFGLSAAAIQAPELSRQQRDNLFWVNTALGVVFGLLVIAASPLLTALYDDDRVQLVAVALSVTFLLNGLSAQYRADLIRRLRFTALVALELTSAVLGVITGIVGALAGLGYWALVAQQIMIPAVGLILAVILCAWIPRLPRRRVGMRRFFSFGTHLVGSQLLSYLTQNIDSIVVGANFGSTALGLYSRAFELLMAPLRQIQAPSTRVALPILSKLQFEPARFNSYLLRGQVVLLGLISSLFAVAAAQAEPLVTLLLGPQWPGVVPIFQIFCLAGLAQAAHYATYWAFVAKGLTASMLRYSLIARPLGAVIIVAGVPFGVLGVALAYSVSTITTWLIGLWWVGRASADLPIGRMFTNGLRTMFVYGFCGVASWFASQATGQPVSVWGVVVGVGVFISAGALIALLWPTFRRDVSELLSFPRLLRRR